MNASRVKAVAGECLTALRLHTRVLGDQGVVVAFHRVSDAYRDSLTCPVGDFERFCRFFQRHFTVLPLGDMVTRLERGQPLSGMLAVTFDDGYRDNYEHAAPILRALGLPATFFVVSGFMDTAIRVPWDADCDPAPAWMTWSQVRELHEHGFTIGAHTQTHVDLGTVAGAHAQREIHGSRRDLEDRLGAPVDLFAYPFGQPENITEANRDIVRRAGFRCCASCFGGTNPRGRHPSRMRRIPITTWYATPSQFAFEVAMGRA